MSKRKRNKLSATNALGAKYATDPTPEAAAELLDAFQGFIQNYVTLLSPRRNKNVKTRLTKNTREFLRLFASKAEFATNKSQAYQMVLRRLPNMAKQSLMDDDDLLQSITMAFLHVSQKFDPVKCGGGGTFTGYIDTHFKWTLKPLLFHSHEDAAKYQPLYEEVLDEQSFSGFDIEYDESGIHIHNSNEITDGSKVEVIIDLPMLTPVFISCPTPPYDTLLNKQERVVLVKHLLEDKSPSAIAAELGYSNAGKIREIYDGAIGKIRSHFEEQLC